MKIDRIISASFTQLYSIIKRGIALFEKRGARVLNIASMSVKEPIPGLMLSNTFRPAIAGWTKQPLWSLQRMVF